MISVSNLTKRLGAWLRRKPDVECGDFSRRSDLRRSRRVQRNPGKEHGSHS